MALIGAGAIRLRFAPPSQAFLPPITSIALRTDSKGFFTVRSPTSMWWPSAAQIDGQAAIRGDVQTARSRYNVTLITFTGVAQDVLLTIVWSVRW